MGGGGDCVEVDVTVTTTDGGDDVAGGAGDKDVLVGALVAASQATGTRETVGVVEATGGGADVVGTLEGTDGVVDCSPPTTGGSATTESAASSENGTAIAAIAAAVPAASAIPVAVG